MQIKKDNLIIIILLNEDGDDVEMSAIFLHIIN